jgi:hypothetical protein
MGWAVFEQSSDRTTGGRVLSEDKAFCPKCMRRRLRSQLVRETNQFSEAFGKLVCSLPSAQGGCFDGPYPTAPARRITPDDTTPIQ